jgi:hypothetical protein
MTIIGIGEGEAVGARGKKRVRANGQIASGKQRALPPPLAVPRVQADQMREGLEVLRAAMAEKQVSETSGPEWQAAYETAQERLQGRYPRMLADAILWRATFLDALIGGSAFQKLHHNDGELPTADMLEVAATIPSYGDDTSFDIDDFEEWLVNRSG